MNLDDLLAESLSQSSEADSLRAKRKKLTDTRVAGPERAELEAAIRRLEALREWTAVANVAQFQTQHCACGSTHSIFSGWFLKQRHRQSKIERWIRPESEPSASLPTERQDLESPTKHCVDCFATNLFKEPAPCLTSSPQSSLKPSSSASTSLQEAPQQPLSQALPQPDGTLVTTSSTTPTTASPLTGLPTSLGGLKMYFTAAPSPSPSLVGSSMDTSQATSTASVTPLPSSAP